MNPMLTAERTPLQRFADARRIVGASVLNMTEHERPTKVVIAERVITVILSVERWRPVRGGVKVTHRGVKWLSLEWDEAARRWDKVIVSDTTEPLAEPELHLSYVEDVASQEQRALHEAMCYRPGTRNHPMDGPTRLAQLKAHGI